MTGSDMDKLHKIFDDAGIPRYDEPDEPLPSPPPPALNFDGDEADEVDEPASTLPPEYLAARARLKQQTADRKTTRR